MNQKSLQREWFKKKFKETLVIKKNNIELRKKKEEVQTFMKICIKKI